MQYCAKNIVLRLMFVQIYRNISGLFSLANEKKGELLKMKGVFC